MKMMNGWVPLVSLWPDVVHFVCPMLRFDVEICFPPVLGGLGAFSMR